MIYTSSETKYDRASLLNYKNSLISSGKKGE